MLTCRCVAISAKTLFAVMLTVSVIKWADADGFDVSEGRWTTSAAFPVTGSFGQLDISIRGLTRGFYNAVFLASEKIPITWNGDVDSCVAGTIAADFQAATLLRYNYFRAMAGVHTDVNLDEAANEKAQLGALMMSANDELNHSPPPSWLCYTADGAEAADNSNLSGGTNGPGSIYSAFRDNGDNNTRAGHRYKTLLPTIEVIGTGDIPKVGEHRARHVTYFPERDYGLLWPASRDNFIAWPPPGYVPYPVVFPRWSFMYENADFSGATVTMTKDGETVPTEVHSRNNDYQQSIVWAPVGYYDPQDPGDWPPVERDTLWSVTIDNVVIDGVARRFQYQLTIFDPTDPGNEPELSIDGPAYLAAGSEADYQFDTLAWSDRYEIRSFDLTPSAFFTGAENGDPQVIPEVSEGYALISDEASASGIKAFHLLHPDGTDQSFHLPNEYLLSQNSRLQFQSRLGYANAGQVARVQISLDSGASWSDIWTQQGTGDQGETAFDPKNVSLDAAANKVAQFRFTYTRQDRYYSGIEERHGWWIDDIELIDVSRVGDADILPSNGSGTFTFAAARAGSYGLQVRNAPWAGFSGLTWGPVAQVEVGADAEPPMTEYLDGGDQQTTVVGRALETRRYLDFGGSDTYAVPVELGGSVTIVDKQAGFLVLPAGFKIDETLFAADGLRLSSNGQHLTLLGKPAAFLFSFAGTLEDPASGILRTYADTATLFGAEIPAVGQAPIAGSVVGTISATGAILP
ncbi:CAP domain-containing protein [Rhabdochromatium marinum]|uniref:CAP domain-containing protein n=1 Tax=Rhabdochromatium marinum TaxID=48729 RepID=UPI00190432FE|nr:CAP domain-containing protein [Rhabdochromatium marinum]MBK1647883.1 hypothetical protein [Rhabdochromatium marinum]